VLESRQEMTGADRQWAGQYELGDMLRYSRGSKTEGIAPGEYARVTGVDPKENRITIERGNQSSQTCDQRCLSSIGSIKVVTSAKRNTADFIFSSLDLRVTEKRCRAAGIWG